MLFFFKANGRANVVGTSIVTVGLELNILQYILYV